MCNLHQTVSERFVGIPSEADTIVEVERSILNRQEDLPTEHNLLSKAPFIRIGDLSIYQRTVNYL